MKSNDDENEYKLPIIIGALCFGIAIIVIVGLFNYYNGHYYVCIKAGYEDAALERCVNRIKHGEALYEENIGKLLK